PQAAEAPGAATQAADVGQHELVRVADDDALDLALARQENADLAAQVARDARQVPGELRSDHVARRHAPAEGPLQRPPLGGLDAAGIAFNLRDGRLSWSDA